MQYISFEHAEDVIKRNILLWDENDSSEPNIDEVQMSRWADGRYEIKWSWKLQVIDMESNEKPAFRRFKITEFKMAKNQPEYEAYNQNFMEQLDKDFIEKAPRVASGPVRYLPHQAVIREEAKKFIHCVQLSFIKCCWRERL